MADAKTPIYQRNKTLDDSLAEQLLTDVRLAEKFGHLQQKFATLGERSGCSACQAKQRRKEKSEILLQLRAYIVQMSNADKMLLKQTIGANQLTIYMADGANSFTKYVI